MSPEEAKRLAHLIIDTWPGHVIKAHVWCNAIDDLDYDTAHAVYEHLRDHDERPPGVARFRAIYASVQPDYGYDRPTDTGPVIRPSLGRQIAWHAYSEECRRQGRHPDHAWFTRILGDAIHRHPARLET